MAGERLESAPDTIIYKTMDEAERELTTQHDLVLVRDGEGMLINRELILSYRFFRPNNNHYPVETLLVGKDKSVPLKFKTCRDRRIIPDLKRQGEDGVLFAYLDDPTDFLVGEKYRVVSSGITEEDRANGTVRIALYSKEPIDPPIMIPGHLNFPNVLQLVRKLELDQSRI